jgi:hypothetical protein
MAKAGRARRLLHVEQRLDEHGHVTAGARRDGVDALPDHGQLRGHLVGIADIADEADRPAQHQGQRRDADGRHGADADPSPAALGHGVVDAQSALEEDHVAQQPSQEEALAGPRATRGQRRALEAEGAAERAHDAVDRCSFLGAAGEVDPPHRGHPLHVAAGGEDRCDELPQRTAQRGQFLRKPEQRGTAGGIAFALEPIVETLPEPLLEPGESVIEGLLDQRILAVDPRQRETPDLLALVLGHVAEGIVEAGHEVHLRDQHVDRRAHAQLGLKFVQAIAQAARQLIAVRRRSAASGRTR